MGGAQAAKSWGKTTAQYGHLMKAWTLPETSPLHHAEPPPWRHRAEWVDFKLRSKQIVHGLCELRLYFCCAMAIEIILTKCLFVRSEGPFTSLLHNRDSYLSNPLFCGCDCCTGARIGCDCKAPRVCEGAEGGGAML